MTAQRVILAFGNSFAGENIFSDLQLEQSHDDRLQFFRGKTCFHGREPFSHQYSVPPPN